MKKCMSVAVFALGCAALFSTGCTTSSSGNVFTRDEALHASVMVEGTVIEVRAGKIEGEQSGLGAVGGAAMGGVVGNLFGGGKGNTIATVGGTLGGAAAGAAIEKGITDKNGLQITVQLDNGQTVVIVQEADVMFSVGQRVRVISGGGVGKDRVQAL